MRGGARVGLGLVMVMGFSCRERDPSPPDVYWDDASRAAMDIRDVRVVMDVVESEVHDASVQDVMDTDVMDVVNDVQDAGNERDVVDELASDVLDGGD